MNRNGSSSKPDRAVLLPIDMGNYGRNRRPVEEIFKELHDHSIGVRFVGYHWRPSGNFIFDDYGEEIRQKTLEAGEVVTGLRCLIRTFCDLRKVVQAVPPEAQTTRRGSVILPTGEKLIHVALSKAVLETSRPTGRIVPRVEILAWPSSQDALCAYTRPPKGGDVGQVTDNVLKIFRKHSPDIYGTGRALSVIRDLLADRNIRYG